jgi:hypothetical protein
MFRKQERTLQECAINLKPWFPTQACFKVKSSILPSLFLLRYSTQGKGKGEIGRVSVIKVYGEFGF